MKHTTGEAQHSKRLNKAVNTKCIIKITKDQN